MKNTGKSSEEQFEIAWSKLGKRAWIHRFVGRSRNQGKNRKGGSSCLPAPSDFLVVYDGGTEFAEVKSTWNKTSFPFSLLRRTQSAQASMILAAGGDYMIYAHALNFDRWFRFPYYLVKEIQKAGKKSIKWEDLQPYKWELPNAEIL